MKAKLFTDGGARGNPGPAGIGAWIEGDVPGQVSKYIGKATNNVAEYQAIIASLEEAKRLGAEEIDSFMDSELACRQLQGRYKVKQPHLKVLVEKVKVLEAAFKKITYTHVPRENERIQMADALVNEALDEVGKRY